MKKAYRISWEQEQNNLINGKGVKTEVLISASVTVSIRPVQLAPKMKELEPPALHRGPAQILASSQVCSSLYLHLPTQCISVERSTPKNFLKLSDLPITFQITSWSVTKSKKGRKQRSDARQCHRELSECKWTFFFPPILLISLNFTTVQIKASPHANNPKQSSDF